MAKFLTASAKATPTFFLPRNAGEDEGGGSFAPASARSDIRGEIFFAPFAFLAFAAKLFSILVLRLGESPGRGNFPRHSSFMLQRVPAFKNNFGIIFLDQLRGLGAWDKGRAPAL
jgi:hypothetical protein